jgi:hypothetical protein
MLSALDADVTPEEQRKFAFLIREIANGYNGAARR